MPPKRKSEEGASNGQPKEKKSAKAPREKIPDVSEMDFTSNAKTQSGKPWNKKFASWNINGIKAWLEKNGHSYITKESPDIFCVQETKCVKEKIPEEVKIAGYNTYWLSGDKEGYSGTGLYSKEKPVSVSYGINDEEHDKEGRVITAEYPDFYFVTAYIPNSGRGLVRLDYRTKQWDPAFRKYIKELDSKKPVILCGDLNVAHLDIDLSNPKNNKNKTPGFTDAEREQFTELLNEGFLDTFRELHPDVTDVYSFWSYMMNCRAKNVGWRLDYFLISQQLKDNLCDSLMRTDVMGSDHCPIVCLMHF
jgi:AP endonuclease-1